MKCATGEREGEGWAREAKLSQEKRKLHQIH